MKNKQVVGFLDDVTKHVFFQHLFCSTPSPHKEERDVVEEELKKIDECDMEEFGTLDSREKTIDMLGDT